MEPTLIVQPKKKLGICVCGGTIEIDKEGKPRVRHEDACLRREENINILHVGFANILHPKIVDRLKEFKELRIVEMGNCPDIIVALVEKEET